MRGVYAQLDTLKARLGPFTFKIAFTDITRVNFPALAAKFQVNVPEPPDDTKEVPFTSPYAVQNQTGFTFVTVTLDLPDGYAVSSATLTANQAIGSDPNFPVPFLMVMHVGSAPPPIDTTTSLDTTVNLDFLTGLSGKQFVVYGVAATPAGVVEIDVTLQLLSAAFEAWQQQVCVDR